MNIRFQSTQNSYCWSYFLRNGHLNIDSRGTIGIGTWHGRNLGANCFGGVKNKILGM